MHPAPAILSTSSAEIAMFNTKTIPASMVSLIERVKDTLEPNHLHAKLSDMFEGCFLNAFTTTLRPQTDGTIFVVTGDIPAMWLRDSSAQVRPYLIPARQDQSLADLLVGISGRQLEFVLHDPYANAFNESSNRHGHQQDLTTMTPLVWERKYELDSLAYTLEFSYLIWHETGRTDHLDWRYALVARSIIKLWTLEQHHERSPYTFERLDTYLPTDTLPHAGRGTSVGFTGMTWSGFRPSDDACTYGYLVPANMQAVMALEHLETVAREVLHDDELRLEAGTLGRQLRQGIEHYGKVHHPDHGEVYAYEVDGLGHINLMDDANVPSLLSAPYLGYCAKNDPTYLTTRTMLLCATNPHYHAGRAARGIGSPHTPGANIWPISLCIQGLTSSDESERRELLETLAGTDAGTGLMHESFDANDPSIFTREWFAWANSLFAEFVLDLCGVRLSEPEPTSYETDLQPSRAEAT